MIGYYAIEELRLIIGACPCSGTTYIAEWLKAYGFVASCHNLHHDDNGWSWQHKPEQPHIEVAHHFHYRLHLPEIKRLPLVWLVRNPVDVINSWAAKKLIAGKTVNIPEMMLELAKHNEPLSKAENLICIHRLESSPTRLVEVVRRHVPQGIIQPVPISKKTNSHNHCGLRLSKEQLLSMENGQRFWDSYCGNYE